MSLLGVGLSGGCARSTLNTSLPPDAGPLPPQATVAVVPFENLSTSRQAGLALTDLATSVLYDLRCFRVVEPSSVQDVADLRFRRLETAPWERQVGLNTAAAAAVGRALKTDCVLAGSVGEYGFVDGFGETATVGITVRLVRSLDAAVLWSGSLSRRTSGSAFSEESAHRLAQQVLGDLLGQMKRDLISQRDREGRAETR